ncbi:pilus assembly protein [Nocardioides montaniterrae]
MKRALVWGRRGAEERGASAVEFALVVPFLLLIVFGILSFGMMLSFRQTLSQATAEGARAAAVQLVSANRSSAATSAINSALGSMKVGDNTLACGQNYVTCTIGSPTTCGTAQCVTVTVSYLYRDHPAIPSIPGVSLLLPQTLSYSATVRVS